MKIKKSGKPNSMPLTFSGGIICDSGSFAVQFGDHFRSGDHLRSGIICGAVQRSLVEKEGAAGEPVFKPHAFRYTSSWYTL